MTSVPETTANPTIDPRGSHDSLRLRTPAELVVGLRALRDHIRRLDSASPDAALMEDAATYLSGATDSLREHMAMLRELLAAGEWRPIATAPLDRPILVYAAPRYDLPGFRTVAQWDERAGWCVDDLRDPTHWMPLPEPPK